MSDLYGDLGVARDASADAIKQGYRRAAKRAHPDGGGSADKFRRVQAAWLTLRDPAKRAKYDRTGEAGEEVRQDPDHDVRTLIASWFLGQLGGPWRARDLVGTCRLEIERSITEALGAITHRRRRIAEIGEMQARIKHPQPDSFVHRALAAEAEAVKRAIAEMEAAVALRRRALEILAEYSSPVPRPDGSYGQRPVPPPLISPAGGR